MVHLRSCHPPSRVSRSPSTRISLPPSRSSETESPGRARCTIWRCAAQTPSGRTNSDLGRAWSSCGDWMPVKTTASTSRSPPGFMQNAEQYGSGTALVFDTSAWNRRTHPSVLPRWATTRDDGLLAVCPIVALELLAAARDDQAFQALDRALQALPSAPVTRAVCDRALGASRETARRATPARRRLHDRGGCGRPRLRGPSLRSPLRATLPRSRDREHLDREARIDRLTSRQADSRRLAAFSLEAQRTSAGDSISDSSTPPISRRASRASIIPAPRRPVDSAPQATPKRRHWSGGRPS